MKVEILCPSGKPPSELLRAIAARRGCVSEEDITEFLDPKPPLPNLISALPDYTKARDRLDAAMRGGEKIVLFGDYDCDGVSAVAQVDGLLQELGASGVQRFIPERMSDDYGLNPQSVERCYNLFRPNLVFSLDCGSSSHDSIKWLKERGVDTLVLDHHQCAPSEEPHPALAHLNPKGWDLGQPEIQKLSEMSAGGLAFFLCEQLAADLGCQTWRRERSLMMAGLATVADVMPLRGLNRALVKHAVAICNSNALEEVPGLAALKEACKVNRVTAQTFGFLWGPRLNATGRLDAATASLNLLLARDRQQAIELAQSCDGWNRERQTIQREIEKQAEAAAQAIVDADPETRVLVLADKSWHSGVVGIVASHIKERYMRPAILFGWHDEGYWKGSGRSLDPYDLGHHVQMAAQAGLLIKGGGHKLAAGLAVKEERLAELSAWLNSQCPCSKDDFAPAYEALARVEGHKTPDGNDLAKKWHELLDRLEPVGAGNPMPGLVLENAVLAWGPKAKTRKDSAEIWGYTAGFEWTGRGLIFVTWGDRKKAEDTWKTGGCYRLVLSVSSYTRADNAGMGYTWRVTVCEPASQAG